MSPDALLDFTVDWSETDFIVAGDTITTSTWEVAAGLTEGTTTNTTMSATIWLSFSESPAPVIGQTYQVTNHIVTTAGRVTDYTFVIVCQQE